MKHIIFLANNTSIRIDVESYSNIYVLSISHGGLPAHGGITEILSDFTFKELVD